MTIDSFFKNKNLINLPNLNEFGINHEILSEITAIDTDSNALVVAYEEDDELWFAFIYSDKIVCRNYYLDSKLNDYVTEYGVKLVLESCGFDNYLDNNFRYVEEFGEDSIYEIEAQVRNCETLLFNKVDQTKTSYKSNLVVVNLTSFTYQDLLMELEDLLDEEVIPWIEKTIELADEEDDCIDINDYCLNKEEYLQLILNKLVEFDGYITTTIEDVDDAILKVEDRLIENFLKCYSEQVVDNFLREKIIEKILE